jgi:type 1 glutamine amidotransferase
VASGTVVNEDPAFPATKHFPASFPFVDEFYQTKEFSREKLRVLLRLDVSKMPPNPRLRRTDGDFPLAWARTYGKGRVFYSSLGHATETWDNRRRRPDVFRGHQVVPRPDPGRRHSAPMPTPASAP